MAGFAAIVGSAPSHANPGGVDVGACNKNFNAPRRAMLLTRVLKRGLGNGQEVVSRRSYRIAFFADGAGYRIDGELTGVDVSVPPQLEAIAQLERNRRDEGLFPILLNAQGLISFEAARIRPAVPETAHRLAAGMVGAAIMPAPDKSEALQFVDALLSPRGGVMTQWPIDLFRPQAGHRKTSSNVAIANGKLGLVTVELQAVADGACGLVRSFERTVTTEFGGQQRVSRELWTLVPTGS